MSDVTMEIIAVVALVFTTISVVLGLQRMRKKRASAREAVDRGVVAEFCLQNPGLVLVAFVFLLGTVVYLVRGELPPLFTVGIAMVVTSSLMLNHTWRK